ncbi:MAG: hypothetical protein RLN82_08930 [Pseudomonadales bacterium]|uniref:hypothetical protein n=1 Tax=Ekhidna sp. TaxID=2608089 RepID=UPI0032EC6ED4
MGKVRYPFNDAEALSIEDAGTSTLQIDGPAIASIDTPGQEITALSLLAGDTLMAGDEVVVDISQGATGRDVTFGSAGSTIVAPALTGVANDRDVITLVWTATEFIAKTAWLKIVDAA